MNIGDIVRTPQGRGIVVAGINRDSWIFGRVSRIRGLIVEVDGQRRVFEGAQLQNVRPLTHALPHETPGVYRAERVRDEHNPEGDR